MKPGIYPLTGRTTLLQCIAMAGLTPLADLKGVVIFRQIGGKKMGAVFDIKAIRAGNAEDPLVYGDDIVVVDQSGAKTALSNFIRQPSPLQRLRHLLVAQSKVHTNATQSPLDAADEGPEQLPMPAMSAREDARCACTRSQPQALSLDLRSGAEAQKTRGRSICSTIGASWSSAAGRCWPRLAMVLVIALVEHAADHADLSRKRVAANRTRQSAGGQVGGYQCQRPWRLRLRRQFLPDPDRVAEEPALAQRVVSQLGLAESGEMDRLWPRSSWRTSWNRCSWTGRRFEERGQGRRAGNGTRQGTKPAPSCASLA